MKVNKQIYLWLFTLVALVGCSKETFENINIDPNRLSAVPTPSLLITVEKQLIDAIRSEEIKYRGAQLFAQYFSQNIYTDQSRYLIPTSILVNFWTANYKYVD